MRSLNRVDYGDDDVDDDDDVYVGMFSDNFK